jgi:putative toxin-antitoxin system antitoxin component (TIGR02293 family)
MHTKIASDGKNLFVPIPAEILAQAGFKAGQIVEITVSKNTIILGVASEEPSDPHLKRLVAVVHSEALELFEGDVGAKIRWMTLPQASLSGRTPSEMLWSEEDIEAVRLLIGRLEHGSMP